MDKYSSVPNFRTVKHCNALGTRSRHKNRKFGMNDISQYKRTDKDLEIKIVTEIYMQLREHIVH